MDRTAGSRGSFFSLSGADTHSARAQSKRIYHNGYIGKDGIDLCGTTLMLISEKLVKLSISGVDVPEISIKPNHIPGTQIGESIKITDNKIYLYTCGDVSRLRDGWSSVVHTAIATGNVTWLRQCNRKVMKLLTSLSYNNILELRNNSIKLK